MCGIAGIFNYRDCKPVDPAQLKQMAADADSAPALLWAETWLPLYPPDSPLAGDVRTLWIRQAESRWKSGDQRPSGPITSGWQPASNSTRPSGCSIQ